MFLCHKSPACCGPGVNPFLPGARLLHQEGWACTSRELPVSPVTFRTRVIVKAAGPGSTQASQGFSLEQLLGRKANPHPEGSPLFSSGKMRGAVHREPAHWTATAVCGVFIQMYVLREKSKVLQPCTVYILKKTKVLYVFITLIIVIKSLPFLICGLGNFVCFSCLGVSFVLFLFLFFWI